MKKRITKTLQFGRKFDAAFQKLHDMHGSVSTDSVFVSKPGTARICIRSASVVNGRLVTNLEWNLRRTWAMQIDDRQFHVYDQRSHKYWLRELIRRHR